MKKAPFLKLVCLFSFLLITNIVYADSPTAHAPDFANKEVWPLLTGKEAFLTQEWPEGQVMEWARPGEGVGGRDSLDVFDPQNWLLNGETPDEVVFDENTDLLLPDSEEPYFMDFHRVEGWVPIYRHVTVGRNVRMRHMSARFYGNLWVKAGGEIDGRHGNAFLGGAHTFFREDNGTWEDERSGRFGQYLTLRKGTQDVSLEIIGGVSVLDRVGIQSGMFILSANSRFSPGRNATMVVSEGATVVLLDNARLVKWANQIGQVDFTLFGNLQGGLPDRPLEKPAFVELSYQNTTGVKFFDKLTPPSQGAYSLEKRISPLIVAGGASIRSISGTLEGKLNLRWSGIDAKDWHLKGDAAYREWVKGLSEEEFAYLSSQLDAMPKKLVALFQENVSVDGLVFNDLYQGGILVEDSQQARTEWKNVSFGSGNDGEGAAQFTQIGRAEVRDNVKSSGGGYLIGVPVVFESESFPTEKVFTRFEMTATVPPEAEGRLLGVRFYHNGRGWGRFDNVSMTVNGQEVIRNGNFDDPAGAEKVSALTAWKDMSPDIAALGVQNVDGGGNVVSAHTKRSMFGQTTNMKAQAGQKVVLSFEGKCSESAKLHAEIFYLTE